MPRMCAKKLVRFPGGIYVRIKRSSLSVAEIAKRAGILPARLYRKSRLDRAQVERIDLVLNLQDPHKDDELRASLSLALVSGHAVAQLSLPVEYVDYDLPAGYVMDSVARLDSAELNATATELDRLNLSNDPETLLTFCKSFF